MKPKTISEIERIDSFTEGHKIEYGELVDRVMIIEEDAVNTVNNQTTTLSSVDSMKSIIAKVADIPKVAIMASDMLNNLLGDAGNCEDTSVVVNYSGASSSLDTTKKVFGNSSIKVTATTDGAYGMFRFPQKLKLVVGDKYFISAYLDKGTIPDTASLRLMNLPTVGGTYDLTVIDKTKTGFQRVGAKFIAQHEHAGAGVYPATGVLVNQYYNVDGYMAIKLTDDEYNNLTVDQLLTKYPYVNGVQPLWNPCLTVRGKNLVDEKKIVAVGSYIKPTWTGEKLLFDNSSNTANRALTRFPVFLEKGKTYRVSKLNEVIISGSTLSSFGIADSEGKLITTVYTTYIATYSGLHYLEAFTAVGSLQKIELNIQLEEGTVATAYEPYREKQRIYPCELGKVGNYADELEDDGAVVKKIRKNKHMNLDNTLTIAYVGTVSGLGFKIIEADCIDKSIQYNSLICEKYNGTRLSAVSDFSDKDQCYFLVKALNKLRISIANTDSGYGESYNPTTDEIKAYLNGWKMNNGTFGTPYDGAGTKTWTKWNAISNTGSVTVVPTTMADGFTPYQLWYALAQEEQEIIEPIGSLRLEEGYNCIDVSTGIAYERANPQLYNSGGTDYYFINIDPVPLGNLKYKNKRIVKVYRDGTDITSLCDIATISTINGKERIRINKTDYDPNINVITVLYEVLHENYNSQQVQITLEYADNLRTSHNELVEIVEKQEDEINDLLYDLYYSKLELKFHEENYASNENVGHIKLGTIAGTALDGAHDTDKVKHITEYIVNNSITVDANDAVKTGIYYLSSLAINRPSGVVDGALLVMSYNSSTYTTHFFLDWRTNKRYTRVRNNGTWGPWEEIPGISYNDGRYVNSIASTTSNDPNTTQIPYIITNHANSPNAGTYWHIYTMFYASLTSNRAQIAVRYNADINEMYIRALYGSTWTDWTKMAHANPSVINVSASKAITMVDVASVQNCTNASAITITIPTNSSTPFPLGTEIGFIRSGAGTVTFSPASGVTINSSGSKKSIRAQHETCALKKIATDTWILTGSLAT